MLRKRPVGEDLTEWCRLWDDAGHIGKVALAAKYGASYGTARHWRSDSGPPAVKEVVEALPDAPPPPADFPPEPAIALDFVTFDLETTNFKADWGIILSAAVKPFGQEPVVFRADHYDTWEKDKDNDAGITQAIARELLRHAIVIMHYGRKFDIPYLRAKMTKYGIHPLPPMFGIDTWRIAKDNFCVQSRSLDNLVRYFALGKKTAVEGLLWTKAALGTGTRATEAMNKIVQHNIDDCVLLERLAALSFPFLKSIPKL